MHVIRVEKLIHIEFKEYRIFEPFCHDCGDRHIEWFRGLDLGLVNYRRILLWLISSTRQKVMTRLAYELIPSLYGSFLFPHSLLCFDGSSVALSFPSMRGATSGDDVGLNFLQSFPWC
jgi:T5orf172 domain